MWRRVQRAVGFEFQVLTSIVFTPLGGLPLRRALRLNCLARRRRWNRLKVASLIPKTRSRGRPSSHPLGGRAPLTSTVRYLVDHLRCCCCSHAACDHPRCEDAIPEPLSRVAALCRRGKTPTRTSRILHIGRIQGKGQRTDTGGLGGRVRCDREVGLVWEAGGLRAEKTGKED